MASAQVFGKAEPEAAESRGEKWIEDASDCRRCCCCLQYTRDPGISRSTSIFSLLIVLVAWISPVLAVYVSRNTFPQPSSSTAGRGSFSEERAWSTLTSIQTIGPHPVIYKYGAWGETSGYRAAPSNQAVFNLFIEAIQLIAEEASNHVVVELQLPSNSGRIAGWSDMEKSYDFVTARLRVKEPHSSYSKAMLLTAHFDSVIPEGVADEDLNSMGVGMADDAVGCAAVLETFRALATAPEAPMVDIILLLTNGEELGSLGLDSFMDSSPWAQDVGFFLQMDQSGSRGHALAVFGDSQSGEKAAAFAYHAGALHPHTSILLRDFQPWQDMNTDGTRLRETYGLPGIGMYMMEDRCPYHTIYDGLSHIVSGNLQAHGDNFLGVSQAVTRNQEILDLWAKDDSDPSGSAYTIDLLSSSMLLLTPTTMAVLYSILGIAIIFIIGFTTYQADPSARVAVGVNLTFLSLHHFASIVTGLLVSFAIAACVGSNFGYWYRRDGMAVWLYAFPCLCVQLLFGRILLSQRYSKIPDEELQCQSSIATLIVLVLLTLLLALTGLHLSLLFGMCALTRLAGFLLRRICLLKRWMKIKAIKQHETQLAWLGVIVELVLASLGAIYLLDAMRFAVLNFTTSFGEEGQVLPGELTLGLYVGLFLSLAILQSGAVQVLSTKCEFAGHFLLLSLVVSPCLVIAAFALPVYDKYPCVVPGIL